MKVQLCVQSERICNVLFDVIFLCTLLHFTQASVDIFVWSVKSVLRSLPHRYVMDLRILDKLTDIYIDTSLNVMPLT